MEQLNAKQLYEMVKSGKNPVCSFFGQRLIDLESYIDEHMRGKVIAAEILYAGEEDEHYGFTVNIGDFVEFNKPYMLSNYYDDKGRATLNYIEAGFCKDGIDNIFFMPEDVFCNVVDESVNEFYSFYVKNKVNIRMTYVEWLEHTLSHINVQQLDLSHFKDFIAAKI